MKQHAPFFIILLLHLILSIAYTSLIPLGEAPDEPAHLTYARFIANHNRLPATLEERREAGYRSTWPPLYHLAVSVPLNLIGDSPPTRLKSVGDTPRRLIPTNGQTIAAFIHTADEAWPWRGMTLAWHLGRFVSVVLTLLAVSLTYIIAWRLTHQRLIAVSATALHAFLPQVLFIGTVINDDNLLIFLSGLILFTLIYYTQRTTPPGFIHFFFLGALLGLATVAKYNALPLWAITIVWLIWLTQAKARSATQNSSTRRITNSLVPIIVLLAGVTITGGWWFIFIWRNFNQVNTLGLVSGALATLSAGTADASLRQLATGGLSISLPPPATWLEWSVTFFKSFWGLFGGGSTIELPGWVYGFLAITCLLAIISISCYVLYTVFQARNSMTHVTRNTPQATKNTFPNPPIFLSLHLLLPIFYFPLPFIRFILSGNIIETAQGRHLFPALPLIALSLVWGLANLAKWVSGFGFWGSAFTGRLTPLFPLILPGFAFAVSLYSLSLILASYPPLIPLHTTTDTVQVEKKLQTNLTESVSLIGYELGQPEESVLPITLVWQADSIPSEDYLIGLSLTDPGGEPLGNWIGHPVGGRYPTRAWDKGDILRDTILLPLLANPDSTEAILVLNLLDSFSKPIAPTLTLTTNLPLSPAPLLRHSANQLRTDGLSPDAPFSYRSTLSFILPNQTTPPELIAPDNQIFTPASFISNSTGSIANFIVAAKWPSGNYQLSLTNYQLPIFIINRPRQFDPPPMSHVLNANFGDQITILGYDLPQNRVQPGQSFPVTLHLQAQRTMGRDFIIFNHLLDASAIQRGGADRTPQNYYTTLLWVPDEIVSDSHEVSVETDAPPGIYWLDVGLYPADQPGFSLPLVVDGQSIDRNSISLGPIKVGGPPPEIVVAEAKPQNPMNVSFGSEITLIGFDLTDTNENPIFLERGAINPKSQIHTVLRPAQGNLKLFWQANTIPEADYTVFVHFLDTEGNLIAQADSPPATGAYPTSLWDAGEIVIDQHVWPELTPGHYTLQVGLYRPDTGERLPVTGVPDSGVKLAEFEIVQ